MDYYIDTMMCMYLKRDIKGQLYSWTFYFIAEMLKQ